jgi:ornithine carbamoyltransferase
MIKNFINLMDFSADQLRELLRQAADDKRRFQTGTLEPTLLHKTLAMIFEKPSLRTRVSFETGMSQLGGHAIYLAPADIGLGTREPVQDVARVIGRMCDGIMARTFSHDTVLGLAQFSPVPVINALSDHSHPCQAMADLQTVVEFLPECNDPADLTGRTLLFVGDGNNVARSLAVACSKLGMRMILAAPEGYELSDSFLAELPDPDAFALTRDPLDAAKEADVIYTDTWVSMGQEQEKEKRVEDFRGFQVNTELLSRAPSHVVVLHCLPAYRGYEITDDAFEAHAASILEEAENRLHFQRTLLNVLLGQGGIE